jgi:hypothetical protein
LNDFDLDVVVGLIVGVEDTGAPEFTVYIIASIYIAQKVGNRDRRRAGLVSRRKARK